MNERERPASIRVHRTRRQFPRYVVARILALTLSTILVVGEVLATDTLPATDDDQNGTVGFWFTSIADSDWDGYTVAQGDCDNNDPHTRPGSPLTTSGCTGGQVRSCAANGSGWTSCAAFSCEATGSGACYYIDAVGGSNLNAGTSTGAKWQNLLMIADGNASPPAGKHNLVAGDVVYLFNGTYNSTYTTTGFTSCGGTFCIQNRDGTSTDRITIKPYPGQTSVIISANSATTANYLTIEDSDYITLRGVELSGMGLQLKDNAQNPANNIFVDLKVHGHDGVEDNNLSGIYIGNVGGNNEIGYNDVFDNYDRDDTVGGNNRNIVVFGGSGTGNRIHHNKIWNTAQNNGSCFGVKHFRGTSSDRWEFDHNLMARCDSQNEETSFGWNAGGIWMHHNLGIGFETGTACLRLREVGGETNFRSDTVFEYNTVQCSTFSFEPSMNYGTDGVAYNNTGVPSRQCTAGPCGTPGAITIRNNILLMDGVAGGSANQDLFKFCKLGTEAYYTLYHPSGVWKLSESNNLFYTPTNPWTATDFGDNSGAAADPCDDIVGGGVSGASGTTYANRTAWTSAGLGSGSTDVDASWSGDLAADYANSNVNATNKGFLQDSAPLSADVINGGSSLGRLSRRTD